MKIISKRNQTVFGARIQKVSMKTLFNLPTILLVSGIFCSLNHTLQAQTNYQTTAVQSALTTDEAAVQSALTANEEKSKHWVINPLHVEDSVPSRRPPLGEEEQRKNFGFINGNYSKNAKVFTNPNLAVRGILESFIFWAYERRKNYSNLFCAIQIMFQYSQGITSVRLRQETV